MDILVLGSSGYLAGKIMDALEAEGHRIVATQRSHEGLRDAENVGSQRILIPASVDAIEAAMRYTRFDWVINTVCSYKARGILHEDILQSNTCYPLMVLNAVAASGVKRFLTIGTSLPDDFNMYSFSKSIFGMFGRFYAKAHDMDFFNVLLEMFYGPDEPTNRFIPGLIDKMLRGDPINVTVGTQHRDIIAIEDVVKAVMMIVHSDRHGYQDVPVGTGVAPAISELVDFIWRETGCRSSVNKGAVPMRRDEPDCVCDTSVIRQMGAWDPVNWQTGIRNVIHIHKELGEER